MKLDDIKNKEKRVAIGLMSGTSLDGIDACLVEIKGSGINTEVNLIDFMTLEYTIEVRDSILKLCDPKTSNVEDICHANVWLGKIFGEAAKGIMDRNKLNAEDVDFVASHGQTIYHMPEVGATLQIGEPTEIATITGCVTIGDFRPSDMAVGGQGAPLVPYMDYILFTDKNMGRVLINIGGISNMTALKPGADEDDIWAFDCGPGNMLIDRVITILTDGECTYDDGGKRALRGTINQELLEDILKRDAFVYEKPPKSTGREKYNEDMVKELLALKDQYKVEIDDFIATITAYTYEAIAINIKEYVESFMPVDQVFVGGGGSKNEAILKGLKNNLDCSVATMEELDFSSDAKEAIAFAIMGNEFVNHRSNNLRAATGAKSKVVMGKLVYPPSI